MILTATIAGEPPLEDQLLGMLVVLALIVIAAAITKGVRR